MFRVVNARINHPQARLENIKLQNKIQKQEALIKQKVHMLRNTSCVIILTAIAILVCMLPGISILELLAHRSNWQRDYT